jgi:hypothetical protein
VSLWLQQAPPGRCLLPSNRHPLRL